MRSWVRQSTCSLNKRFFQERDMVRKMRSSRGHYPISHPSPSEPGRSKGEGH